MILLRVKSHRAAGKLKRITPEIQWWWNFYDGNDMCSIPEEHVAEAMLVTGITRARPKREVWRCHAW